MDTLDIDACRLARPYSRMEYLGRLLWGLCYPFFRYSPRICFEWRSRILRLFGAKVGRNVHVYRSAYIYIPWKLCIGDDSSIGEWVLIYNLGLVTIGERVTISHRAHLCAGTHDYKNPALPLLRMPINIGSEAWICSDTFIGPGVSVGEGSIAGAGSVVKSNINSREIHSGNPAIFIKNR